MAGKRGNGEGSVYRRKRDGRWVAAFTVGWTVTGNPERKEFVGKTRAEVVRKMTEAQQLHREGKPVKVEAQTVGQFLDRWLRDTVKPNVKPKTYQSYVWAVTPHLKIGLGRFQLQKLSPQDVQQFVNQKASSGLSVKSVKILRDTLRVALNAAMKWDLVQRNVAQLVTLPRAERQAKRVWSVSEANTFFDVVSGHRFEGIFRLALSYAVRQGEILALRWQDVDFERSCLYIQSTQQRVDGRLVSASTKTESSQRRIPFALGLGELLRSRKYNQLLERSAAGNRWEELDMVFTTGRGSRVDVSNLARVYRSAVKRANLAYIPFHRLRHTAASLLKEHGLTDEEIRILLGHASARTTEEFYLHATPDSEARLVRALDQIYSPVAVSVAVKGSKRKVN